MTIEHLTSFEGQYLENLAALDFALHGEVRAVSSEKLQALLKDENAVLMVIKDQGRIVGMATLYVLPKLCGTGALIEDVIVDSAYRGQGLGEKLGRALIEEAKMRGVGSISLTSRADRTAAHALYEKIGFRKKETNVFRMKLK